MRPQRYPYQRFGTSRFFRDRLLKNKMICIESTPVYENKIDADSLFEVLKHQVEKEYQREFSRLTKASESIGDLEVDLEQHDVLLTVRGQRPVLLIDGELVTGVSKLTLSHGSSRTSLVVSLNESIKQRAYPFNDFHALQRLFQKGHKKTSVRDICLEKH